jgi:hypothetical protein
MRNIVRLKILSENLAPEDISTKLGLTPSRSWRKGERDRKKASLNMAKWNGWILESGCAPDVPIVEQLKILLCELEPHQHTIQQISYSSDVTISLVTYSNPDRSLYLDKGIVAILTSLGANLDLDVYDDSLEQ